ncbi:acetylglucosaminyldiphospho-UDP acetyl-beta-D-mannosaminyltransferase [Mesobacillus campisalis]|uniref:N-acetylglucosaminyldiphosphoundecaprenol N-acetyl-beta-D-mannosaminyltransferase n=1 Tax=Mesobacillus campisalis TaxID=1408103 RepID=A0A0M2SW41_9BACI|nr:WecB/TagA/CpsF family glycosyltransferase [Mesobacillus campisalis]KKK38794.1 acetylglucosaminyldiphospho-UDP acetyl-beta-D-mannosaminyltransferase [Mesobacillus campisalis]
MKKQHVNILGINFINIRFEEMAEELAARVGNEQKAFVVTANPEIVMYADAHQRYKNILDSADYVVADGTGIVLASRLLNTPLKERVTGFDLTLSLLQKADQNNWSIYLLGGRPEVNAKAAENIKLTYPGLKLAGNRHGFFDWKDPAVVDDIRETKPDIVLVALGFPKQEQWISLYKDYFEKGIFIGVGGTIDILAGKAKRAPILWRKLNMEWLYRLLKQPSRWRRMLALPRFVVKVMKK